ncbi:hypothetical protein G3M48_000723 [Beauveria asiatica]|uniref:Uncharacterized protein n=1 Tax=Beauveria asiatica TaxID=1069075 RepID=A0AAW0S061_9HYPO
MPPSPYIDPSLLNGSRGPAKGYTEALEHRLRETETALLRIVSVVDGPTLEAAFHDSGGGGGARGGMPDAISEAKTDKAEMAAHWETFPLSTPGDIMTWANEQLPPSQDSRAGDAEVSAVRLGQQLSNHGSLMDFEMSLAENMAEFPQLSTNVARTPRFLPGGPTDSSPQDHVFDMPEQFKEQYLW